MYTAEHTEISLVQAMGFFVYKLYTLFGIFVYKCIHPIVLRLRDEWKISTIVAIGVHLFGSAHAVKALGTYSYCLFFLIFYSCELKAQLTSEALILSV